MAINFPNSPTLYQIYSSDGSSFIWNGKQWVGYSTDVTVNYNASSVVVADNNIVSGATTTINFGDNLSVLYSSGIATITGSSSSQWNTSGLGIYTLSNIGVGTINPTSKLTVYDGSISLQYPNKNPFDISQLADNTWILRSSGIEPISISVNNTQRLTVNNSGANISGTLTATSFAGDGSGLTNIPRLSQWVTNTSGIHTLSNVGIGTTNSNNLLTVGAVGSSTTSLHVNGNARVTGILSVGQGSVILDGNNNTITTPDLVVTNNATIKGQVVSISRFNPVADGVKDPSTGVISGTDNTTAFRNALDYLANIGGGTLYVPTGKYAFYNNSSTRLEITGNTRIIGDGPDHTILYFNDSASTTRRDFLRSFSTNKIDIILEDLAIIGDWGANGNYTERSHLVQFEGGSDSNVHIHRCRFEYSRYFALVIGYTYYGNRVICTDSTFYRIAGDGLSVRYSKHLIASNNYFKDVNDDSIAFHTREPQPSPVETSAVITGNKIVDSQGICLLGCKDTTISGNSLTRIHTRAIQIGGPWSSGNTGEGKTANVAIVISNNVIDTVFDGSSFSNLSGSGNYYIYIDGIQATALNGFYVGGQNGSGGVLQPYPYFYRNDVGDVPPSPGNWFINISSNTCVRTYAPTTRYSDYGYGVRFGRSGPIDPQITSTTLGYNTGENGGLIHLNTRAFNVLISNNILDGHARGIRLEGSNSASFNDWRSILISNNIISNFTLYGIHVIGSTAVEINSNLIDGDPLFISQYRGSNGTWTFGTGSQIFMAAIINEGLGRCIIKNNSFKNVQSVLNTASLANQIFDSNTYYFNPAGDAFNTSNVGIGYFDSSYQYDRNPTAVIYDGNPNNSTYDEVLNICYNVFTGRPTSGKYVKGHFVLNNTPTVLGTSPNRYIVNGWKRLTTGSTHNNITDWVDVRNNIE